MVEYAVFKIGYDSDADITIFETFEEAKEYAEEMAADPDSDVVYIDINNGDNFVMIKQ